jgi:hypothetical protein
MIPLDAGIQVDITCTGIGPKLLICVEDVDLQVKHEFGSSGVESSAALTFDCMSHFASVRALETVMPVLTRCKTVGGKRHEVVGSMITACVSSGGNKLWCQS